MNLMVHHPMLRFRATSSGSPVFHVVRHSFRNADGFYVHGHVDFSELFWIEEGKGIHLVNGEEQKLSKGSLVMVRQGDRHGFSTDRKTSLALINLSFPSALLEEWGQRHFAGRNMFFWSKAKLPEHFHCSPVLLRQLRRWQDRLAVSSQTPFHLEWFLTNLIHALLPEGRHKAPGMPLPLLVSSTLDRLREPAHFTHGPRHLAALAGCTLQHLNRTLMKHLGRTTGDLLGFARLDHAARQLQLTDRKIIDISMDCGFQNLGHFYQQFKKRYGMTPRQFRLSRSLVIRGG